MSELQFEFGHCCFSGACTNLNNYIEEGYKITKETSSQKQKTFTLKKGNELVLCIVILHHHDTRCFKP